MTDEPDTDDHRQLPLSGVQQRWATAADLNILIHALYLALYVPPGGEPFPKEVVTTDPLRRYYHRFGERFGDIGEIATVDGRPVGACWSRHFAADQPGYGWVADDVPELTIAVQPGFRGLGLGTMLLTRHLEALRLRGGEQVSLSVDPSSGAYRLYRRFGFVPVGHVDSSITMVLDL